MGLKNIVRCFCLFFNEMCLYFWVMRKVFIYWDNSNIFYQTKQLAYELNGDDHTSPFRIRLEFENLLRLAHANRPVAKTYVAGSIPPETEQLWKNLKSRGVDVSLYDRGSRDGVEQQVPDQFLQLRMMEDCIDNNPNTIVLLTGDGDGYTEGRGFHKALERAYKMGWKIELLSWKDSCSRAMRQWAETHGVFIALDDYYKAVTFLISSEHGTIPKRIALKLDLSNRQMT